MKKRFYECVSEWLSAFVVVGFYGLILSTILWLIVLVWRAVLG